MSFMYEFLIIVTFYNWIRFLANYFSFLFLIFSIQRVYPWSHMLSVLCSCLALTWEWVMIILRSAIVQEMFAQCHQKLCKIIFFIKHTVYLKIVFWLGTLHFYNQTELIDNYRTLYPTLGCTFFSSADGTHAKIRPSTPSGLSMPGDVLFLLPTFQSLACIFLCWLDWRCPLGTSHMNCVILVILFKVKCLDTGIIQYKDEQYNSS